MYDSEMRRIYIMDVFGKLAVILESESWVELGRVENVLGFDERRNELYQSAYDSELFDGYGLVAKEIPDRWELIEMAKAVVGQ